MWQDSPNFSELEFRESSLGETADAQSLQDSESAAIQEALQTIDRFTGSGLSLRLRRSRQQPTRLVKEAQVVPLTLAGEELDAFLQEQRKQEQLRLEQAAQALRQLLATTRC